MYPLIDVSTKLLPSCPLFPQLEAVKKTATAVNGARFFPKVNQCGYG